MVDRTLKSSYYNHPAGATATLWNKKHVSDDDWWHLSVYISAWFVCIMLKIVWVFINISVPCAVDGCDVLEVDIMYYYIIELLSPD